MPEDTHEPSPRSVKPTAPALARTMGLGALIIYGVGDMLGAGIYMLIGKAAGQMGGAVWLAFVASMFAAAFTGLSYASLGSRHPRAAGASHVAQRAFGWPFLSYMVGLASLASGLTSMAAGSRAFGAYFLGLLEVVNATPTQVTAVAVGFVVVLTIINYRGMRESTWMNALCTGIECTGLLIVIAVGIRFWGGADYLAVPPSSGGLSLSLVLSGAVLTFYSFVGFEDMINVTEEVKEPERNFPIAIIAALAITTLIYIAVAITAVSVVPHAELANSGQPLVEVVRRAAPWFPSALFSVIALFAIMNTGLLNFITGSRIAYGLAGQGLLPRVLGKIHPLRRTPHVAIFILAGLVLALAASRDVSQLAQATSVLLLTVFVIVNVSLIALKLRPGEKHGRFEVPLFVPVLGIIICAVVLSHAQKAALQTAAVMLLCISALYFLMRPKNAVVGE